MRLPNPGESLENLLSVNQSWFDACIDVGVQDETKFLRLGLENSLHILIEPDTAYHSSIGFTYRGVRHKLIRKAVSLTGDEIPMVSFSLNQDGKVTHNRIKPGLNEEAFEQLRKRDPEVVSWELIETVTLDQIVDEENFQRHRYSIKIDVDGIDAALFEHSAVAVPNAACIFVEAVGSAFAASDREISRMIAIGHDQGFQLIDIVSPCYYGGRLAQVDLVFLSKELLPQWQHRGAFDPSQWQSSKIIEEISDK